VQSTERFPPVAHEAAATVSAGGGRRETESLKATRQLESLVRDAGVERRDHEEEEEEEEFSECLMSCRFQKSHQQANRVTSEFK